MHQNGSFLYTVIERIRWLLDEPTIDAKFTDAFLVQHIVYPAMVDVLSRINLNNDNPVVVAYTVEAQEDRQYYPLPSNVGEVWRVVKLDSSGNVVADAYPRGPFAPTGPGWELQGNELCFRPYPKVTETLQVWYVPNGDVRCHYGTGTLRGTRFTLASSPTLGLLDRRPNAYAGSILRLLPSTGMQQERVIASHDAQTGIIRLRTPFHTDDDQFSNSSGTFSGLLGSTSSSGAGSSEEDTSSDDFSNTFLYEIAPQGYQSLYEAVAYAGACKMAASKNVPQQKMVYLTTEYRKAMKSIIDNAANMNMRTGKSFMKDTVDHPSNRGRII